MNLQFHMPQLLSTCGGNENTIATLNKRYRFTSLNYFNYTNVADTIAIYLFTQSWSFSITYELMSTITLMSLVHNHRNIRKN